MRFELNQKQKNYLLTEMFEPYDVYQAFHTIDVDSVANSKLEASTDADDLMMKGWPTIIMDGEPVTCVNARDHMEEWRRLLELGD